jgi:RimJ/RimL family protein N-acetyltransferase
MSVLPERIETARLELRVPRWTDVAPLNAAICESFAELNPWMPWLADPQSLEETREFCLRASREREADTACALLMVHRADGVIVGGTGYPRLDLRVPKFEIGYWCRTSMTGRGYALEATAALTRHAFAHLDAERVELRIDDLNERSWRVAERLGFTHEALLRRDTRDHHARVRDTRVYAMFSLAELRPL